MSTPLNRSFCIAPMMKCTDRYFRQLARIMSRHAMLYTEMISCKAAIHGNAQGILDFDPIEQPLALQIGGRDIDDMRKSAQLAQQWGYAEININAGCPSKCASAGGFGAHLMKEPQHLAQCVRAMQDAVDIPVTIKCRTGVEGRDAESDLNHFIHTTAQAGCKTFIVHARSAILGKLSPKQNRNIPPLDYDRVYRLKEAFPECEIIINGGIKSLEDAQKVRQGLDGVMLGRSAYEYPMMLLDVDHLFYAQSATAFNKAQFITDVLKYVERHLANGVPAGKLFKHIMSLFKGQPHAREWRRWLSDSKLQSTAGTQTLEQLKVRFEAMVFSAGQV